MRKIISRRYSGLVMGALMAIVMGLMMSFVVTFLNLGLSDTFFEKWMKAFLGALPIGFPVALFVTPLIKSFVDKITK